MLDGIFQCSLSQLIVDDIELHNKIKFGTDRLLTGY